MVEALDHTATQEYDSSTEVVRLASRRDTVEFLNFVHDKNEKLKRPKSKNSI